MNATIEQLTNEGQSLWLDSLSRAMIRGGELAQMIAELGVTGVTTNPTIFEKAIDSGRDYDADINRTFGSASNADALIVYERLAVSDVRQAADVLRPIYDTTRGADGFVSIEVSPYLAHDTDASVREAKRLWSEVDRPNLMIKIPATKEGLPAIEALLRDSVNVNITLMFSMAHYEAVAGAFIRGVGSAPHPERIASVASIFVSRIDTAVDRALEQIGSAEALTLRGKAGIANARLIYRRFKEMFGGGGFTILRNQGVRMQRVLWGSTGTKNPAYSDVMYVEDLIGEDTVNTVPPATLRAFAEHGRVRGATVEQGIDEAASVLDRLARLGVELGAITETLQAEGLAKFTASLDQVVAAIARKRAANPAA